MNLIDVNLAESPVDLNDFEYFSADEYPKIIIGSVIKHKYDQKRLIVNEKYNFENILFIEPKPSIKTYFFKGAPIRFDKKYQQLYSDLEHLSNSYLDIGQKFEEYKDTLQNYKLDCDDCAMYFDSNVFPINGKHLDKLTGNKFKIHNLYEDFFKKDSENYFQCLSSLNIFMLFGSVLSDEVYESLYQG